MGNGNLNSYEDGRLIVVGDHSLTRRYLSLPREFSKDLRSAFALTWGLYIYQPIRPIHHLQLAH
jgi:hypothetical protein